MKSNRLLIVVVVAMLSSPGAVAGQQLFGVSPGPLPVGGATPVAIDPTSGTVTGLSGSGFGGSGWDVVSSANTLYVVNSINPTLLNSVNETTGVLNFTFLNAPVTDMTVDPVSGKLFGVSPGPLPVGGATPVAIDPTSGTVTGLSGSGFGGSGWDVVSSANTLYVVNSINPTLLNSVNETTGVLNFTFLNAPVTDMTVDPASGKLFGMSPVPGGETPVAIDPTSGTVTGLTPGTSFTGSLFDVVSLADTLYFVSSTNPTLLFSVNETTGVQNFIFLNAPVTDMTAGVTGASTVPIPGALPLFATGLGALGLLGWRRKKKAAA